MNKRFVVHYRPNLNVESQNNDKCKAKVTVAGYKSEHLESIEV